jgi:hypothetical protein
LLEDDLTINNKNMFAGDDLTINNKNNILTVLWMKRKFFYKKITLH